MEPKPGRHEKILLPFDDTTPVDYDKNGAPIEARVFAKLFSTKPPETQIQFAYNSVEKRRIKADFVLSWITDAPMKERFKVWCLGKNIEFEEEKQKTQQNSKAPKSKKEVHPLIHEDEELINKLAPHLRQIDLARILAIKRYREADPSTQHTLVSGVYRLVGDYLGPRRYYSREPQESTLIPLPDLPPELLQDDLIAKLLFESQRDAILPIFNQSLDEGFRYLQELKASAQYPEQIELINKLEAHSRSAVNLVVPGFKDKIAGSQKDVPAQDRTKEADFPSYHQQEYALRFITKDIGKVDLLLGAMGTMKTNASIYAMKAAGAKSTVVVCPPSLRDNWEREIREISDYPVNIFKVETSEDFRRLLTDPKIVKPEFIIIGYSFLSRLSTFESPSMFKRLKEKLQLDSLIADEVHIAKEPKSNCTQQLYLLSHTLDKDAARIAMTGTGVVNSVEDLDAPVRTLLPYDYENQGDFTRSARNDPYFVSALLQGKQLMTRWTAEGILGKELPSTEYHDVPVPLSPFHQKLYDFVYLDNTSEGHVKRGILRQVSLDPMLIRKYYHPSRITEMIANLRKRHGENTSDRQKKIVELQISALEERFQFVTGLSNRTQAIQDFHEAFEKFIQWKTNLNIDEVFNEDFLIRLGYDQLALWSFFNLPNGIDELVKQFPDAHLRQAWKGKNGLVSSNYQKLKEILDPLAASGKTKVIISSGFYQSYVSTGIEDTEDDDLAFLSLYDHLRLWYGEKKMLKIDGSVEIEPKKGELAKREQVKRKFRLDPATWLLATNRSARLGIDLTIPDIEANKNIEDVVIIQLDPPDTHADSEQLIARVRRKGQKLPIKVVRFKTTHAEQPHTVRYGFISHEISRRNEVKRLLGQMVQDTIPLTPAEEEFMKSSLSTVNVQELYPQTPRMYLNNKLFLQVRGAGTKKNMEYLNQVGFEGMTNADFFANYYSQYDELTLPGHNARAVAEIIKTYQKTKERSKFTIGSIGAGSAILQLNLGQPIVNVDILKEILLVAKRRQKKYGHYVVGDAAHIPIQAESFDITDASLVFHWLSNEGFIDKDNQYTTERAIALQELNRVTKMGGLVTITIPHTHLADSQFSVWKNALEQHFGFRLRLDSPSGMLQATDYKKESISWVFTLEKIAEPSLKGLNIRSLSFEFEKLVHYIDPSKRRETNGAKSVSVDPLLPHQEFEIYEPPAGTAQKIVYQSPFSLQDLEEMLTDKKTISSRFAAIDNLSQLGIEEYGLFARLTKEARRTGRINRQEAEELALQAMDVWMKNGEQKHDIYKIWSELRVILNEIKKGGDIYGS